MLNIPTSGGISKYLINQSNYISRSDYRVYKDALCSFSTDETVVMIKRRNAYGIQTAHGWLGGLHKGEITSLFAAWFSPDGEALLQVLVEGSKGL
ncbi:MAG: hypothetical protein COA45_10280 [Zetaproteobacteria bacterium]|nr:MAG: hypothetical protein COA45_10280 [Zetaproteobacteria bacterium]